MAAYFFNGLIKNKRYKIFGFSILIGLLSVYGGLTINRNKVWASNMALHQNMIKTAPNSIISINNWARLLLANGYTEEAKRQAKTAISIHPFAPAYDFLGEIYWKEKNYTQADEYFKKAIEINPKQTRSYNKLGEMYYETKKYNEAVDILTYPVSFDPHKRSVLIYALALIKTGGYQSALDTIIKNYGENPSESKLKLALGIAYFKLGQKEKAKPYLDTSKDPSTSEEELNKLLNEF